MLARVVCLALLAACAVQAAPSFDLSNADLHEAIVSDLQGRVPDKMEGLYVTPCLQYGSSQSFFQTRYYHEDDNKYEIDNIYYTGDPKCVPLNSDVAYKYTFQGTLIPGPPGPNYQTATLNWQAATIFVAERASSIVDRLNKECPCGTGFEVGKARFVTEDECTEHANRTFTYKLCNIVTGKSEWFTWNITDANHYYTSPDCFTTATECWAQVPNATYVREKIPATGNDNPDNCDYKLFAKCRKGGLEDAIKNCESCSGLECSGCIFRELNPDWPDPSGKSKYYKNWSDCCPCIHFIAQEDDKNWANVLC